VLAGIFESSGRSHLPAGIGYPPFFLGHESRGDPLSGKYAAEILWPLKLKSGTGYVGAATPRQD